MIKEAQKNVNHLKDIKKQLKELQDEFFTEIKLISDIAGIAMPEPSEIDLLTDKVQNPLQLIEAYKKEKGIAIDPAILDILQNTFADMKPVFSRQIGGSEYSKELLKIIQE